MYVAAAATLGTFNTSLVVVVGNTVNFSCFTTFIDSVDFYYQSQEGASPILIYANSNCLNNRFNVVNMTGECRERGGREVLHGGGPGKDGSIVLKYTGTRQGARG